MSAIHFYLDYLSPYAYVAWHALRPIAASRGRAVEARPVLLAALLKHHGHLGPAEIPAKREYVFKDVSRTAARMKLPLSPPPAHPFNPLLPLRVTALEMSEEIRHRLVDALFDLTWGGKGGIEDAKVVERVCETLGIEDAIARATAPEGKAAVRALTEGAIQAGAFGTPTMIVDGELFFGHDSLGHLGRFLDGEDPVDPAMIERWRDLPSTARRT